MNRLLNIFTILLLAYLFNSCTSIMHVYGGRQYLPDEELGALSITENYRVHKFDGENLSKSFKSTVIKAKPGSHQLQIIAKKSEVNSTDSVKNDLTQVNEETITWDAIAGHKYQLVSSDSQVDKDKFRILDVTNNQ